MCAVPPLRLHLAAPEVYRVSYEAPITHCHPATLCNPREPWSPAIHHVVSDLRH